MSTIHRTNRSQDARCERCDHDLVVKPERIKWTAFKRDAKAYVYCTNNRCHYSTSRHPTGKKPNQGRYKA